MPNNTGKKISRIFGSCVFILLSAQIVFGCVWGILNFTSFQEFPESAEMILLSSGLALKSDTSVIYPALLTLVRTLTLNGPVRFYEVMYVLQLVLAFAAWHTFAVKVLPFENRFLRIWFTLAVITNPFAMQCHFAVLEFSVVSSFLCLLVTFTIRFSLEWKKLGSRFDVKTAVKHICVTSLFWLLVSLTRKEFFFIGFFCMVILIDRIWVNLKESNKIAKLSPVIIFLVFFAAIHFIDGAFRVNAPHTVADIVKRSIYMRVAWTEDIDERAYWPAHVVTVVDENTMYHTMYDPGIVRTTFTDEVEKKLGRKETSDSFVSWAWDAFKDNKKGLLKDTFIDAVGYVFPPLETEIALRGKALPGFATGNYDVMRRNVPVFTKYYLRLSTVIYIFMALVSAIYLLFKKGLLARLRNFAPVLLVMLLSSFVYVFYGTNVWDHKKVLFATCIWIGLFAALAVKNVTGKEEV